MKKRIVQFIPVIITLLAIGFRYLSNWCIDFSSCYGTWVSHIALSFTKPLYFFALYSLPLAIVLIFVSRAVFKSWLKLAIVLIPILVLYIASVPTSWAGFGINLFPFYRDDAARAAAGYLTVFSLVLFAWKYFKAHRANTRVSKNTA